MEQNRTKKQAVNTMQRRFLKAYAAPENRFNVTAACQQTRIGRTTIYRWLTDDPSFKEAFDESRESRLDAIEAALHSKAVEEKDTTALIFLAKTLCKNRGYVEAGRSAIPEKSSILTKVIDDLMAGTIAVDHAALLLAKEGIPLPEGIKIMLTRMESNENEHNVEGATSEELDQRWEEAMAEVERQREHFLPKRQAEVSKLKAELHGQCSFDEPEK